MKGRWARPAETAVMIAVGLLLVAGPVALVELASGLPFLSRAWLDALVALAGYLAFGRLLERRAVSELSLRGLAELPLGLALGGAVFGLTILSIWVLGGVAFDGWAVSPDLSYALALSGMAGVVEELAIRGVVFRLLERALGSWVALAISALLFGGLHLTNPNASILAALAIALEAGVMLGTAMMATGRLYLPIGIHAGWNFTQGGIFGVAVSGHEMGGLLTTRPIGPDWLSGGAFGAEASVLAVVWCGALGLALLILAARRGRVVAFGGVVGLAQTDF